MQNSYDADYVKLWYGHVSQLDKDGNDLALDLGQRSTNATSPNPNRLAQDWVLGRQALFLRDTFTAGGQIYTDGVGAFDRVHNAPGFNALAQAVTDVSIMTLDDLTGSTGALDGIPSNRYKEIILGKRIINTPNSKIAGGMVYSRVPLLTLPSPTGTDLESKDIARNHTYYMGGVSDFIIEFAGDLVTDHDYANLPTETHRPDGELDRDPDGRIKWYTGISANYKERPGTNPPVISADLPVTYFPPRPGANGSGGYQARASTSDLSGVARAGAAFIWQHEPAGNDRAEFRDADFTGWPWMLRIRYRLHDRRGEFEGRQITNLVTGESEPEPGAWFEVIVPVNHQGIK